MLKKSLKENNLVGKYWLLPFSIFIVLLIGFIFSSKITWMLIFCIFILATLLVSFLFWLKFLLPKLDFHQLLKLSNLLIFHPKNYYQMILSIEKGVIQDDFGLLTKKPKIHILNIDQDSVSLVKDSSNQLLLFSHGTHVFTKEPEIIASFDLSPHLLELGPSTSDDLKQINFQESPTEYLARFNASERTKTRLSSGESIYPFFTIIYRIETTMIEIDNLQIITNLSNFLKPGNVLPLCSRHLDLFISNKVLECWQKYCQEKNKPGILSEFPGIFIPSSFSIKGVALKVYVPHIY